VALKQTTILVLASGSGRSLAGHSAQQLLDGAK